MIICDPRLLFDKIIKNDRKKFYSISSAFTIVELLVVIVVIGILAAITIVSYTGITARATASALQSDLTSASQQLKLYQIDHSVYPSSLNASNCPLDSSGVVDNTYCLKPTSGNTFLYSSNNNSTPQTFSLYSINTSTNTKYRTTNDSTPTPATPVVATGGTITNIGGYRIHTFTTSGTFTVTSGDNVEVLVVGGGGGGGYDVGGGGGAGGLIYKSSFAVSPGAISVTIGNGGASDNNGQNSVFSTLTAIGGGAGGKYNGGAGNVGGSGGGGGGSSGTIQGVHALGTTDQGNSGGDGWLGIFGGGSGGGAGGQGLTATDGNGRTGGIGAQYSISGVMTYYAGGGGAGGTTGSGAGGLGGGGVGSIRGSDGSLSTGLPGQVNTGGGGGGPGGYGGGGMGGSGIVIIRYPN